MNAITRALPSTVRLTGRRFLANRAFTNTLSHMEPSHWISMPPRFDTATVRSTRSNMSERQHGSEYPAVRSGTMPPGYKAEVAQLDTFKLPERVTGSFGDQLLGKAIVETWRRHGIIQIAMNGEHKKLWETAKAISQRFFKRPRHEKAKCVDSQSYAGYIASGEEMTDGIADYSEIFTITKDMPLSDPRVRAKWPCHGRCPWPDTQMKEVMSQYNAALGVEGEKLLDLIEMGLGVAPGSLTRYTRDGWHHTRVLRFPPRNGTNGKGKEGRGIGSHTDYGLLVIAAQDDVGGLFIRPPRADERFSNWEKSAAGLREDDDGWHYIPPVDGVHTVILGDMMQYLTHNHLTATPHKVGLNTRERFSYAYFHEPSFQAVLKPLDGMAGSPSDVQGEGIHYGTHFTNMFIRNYPDRITTKRMEEENRYSLLNCQEIRTIGALPSSE